MKVVSASRSPSGPGGGVVDGWEEGGAGEPVTVGPRSRRCRQEHPVNGALIEVDLVHDRADGLAGVRRLPGRAAEVGDDQLAVVVVQVRPRHGGTPRRAVARVDLDAGGVTDEEDLVADADLDRVWDRGARGAGHGDLYHRQ